MERALARPAAGELSFAVGGEYRKEEIDYSNLIFTTPGGFAADRKVIAGYGELHTPLVAPAQSRMGLQRLELSLAVRAENYSRFGGTTNPKIALLWQPAAAWKVRASYGEAFIAPSLQQAFDPLVPLTELGIPIFDPVLNVTYPFDTLNLGGNPDLQAETSRNFNAGIQFEPAAVPGLSVTLGYYDIRYLNKISYLDYITAIELESLFPQYITRDPATNRIVAITSVQVNLAAANTDGMDLQIEYVHDTRLGEWSFGLNGAWIDSYVTQDAAGSPKVERVDTVNNPVDLQASVRLGYRRGGFDAALNGRYTDSYAANFPSQTRVSSYTALDCHFGYEFGKAARNGMADRALQGLRLGVGVTNLLDKDPPIFGDPFGYGFDTPVGDPRGRMYSLEFAKSF